MGMHRETAATPVHVRLMVLRLVAVKRGIADAGNRNISMADGSTHEVRRHALVSPADAVTAAFPILPPVFTEVTAHVARVTLGVAAGAAAFWAGLVYYLM